MAFTFQIEALTKSHNREAFDCGEEALNRFLKKSAYQNAKNNVSQTYVAVSSSEDSRVLGYFTLSAGRVSLSDVDEAEARRLRLPRYPVPVVLLGRLAVCLSARGRGLGRRLLIEALERAHAAAGVIGAVAVEVEAKDDSAKAFYVKYGFTPLLDDSRHLWLSMKVITKLLAG